MYSDTKEGYQSYNFLAGVQPRVTWGVLKRCLEAVGVSAYAVASRLFDTASQMPRHGFWTSREYNAPGGFDSFNIPEPPGVP